MAAEPAFLAVPMNQYVRDAFEGPPSLSSGIAHLLLTRSALHAFTRHARLNPGWTADDSRDFDLGTAAHAVLLEGKPLHIVSFVDEKTGEVMFPTDYKKKAAAKARDEARSAGLFPVLEHQAGNIASMVAVARGKLAACPGLGCALDTLLAERTLRWQSGGAWLRCRPDWLSADAALVISYKTTRASAEPSAFLRTILGSGYDLQAAFEMAAVTTATGTEPQYVWLVQECAEPFACSLIGMTGELRDFAAMKLRRAVTLWAYCLGENRWPAYSDEIERPELPAWAQSGFIDRHGYQAPAVDDADDGRDISDQLIELR